VHKVQVGLSMLALQIYRIAYLVNFYVIPNAYKSPSIEGITRGEIAVQGFASQRN